MSFKKTDVHEHSVLLFYTVAVQIIIAIVLLIIACISGLCVRNKPIMKNMT